MFCPYCGVQVPDGAAYCPKCGKPQTSEASFENAHPASPVYQEPVPTEPVEAAPATPNVPPPAPPAYQAPQSQFAPPPQYPATSSAPVQVYAGFWLRFVAIIIDAIILGIVGAVIGAIFGSGSATDFLTLLLGWMYFSVLESSPQMATLGKQALGLVVTDTNGMQLTFGRATGRYFAKLLSVLTIFIGYIMAGFTAKKQALHDLVASTLVIKKDAQSLIQTGMIQ